MQCCGALSPIEWTKGQVIYMGIRNSPSNYNIPQSCCRSGVSPKDCATATHLTVGGDPDSQIIYDRGCYTLIMSKLADSVCTIMIVGGIILAVQVLGLLLGLILACSMNRSHRYKA